MMCPSTPVLIVILLVLYAPHYLHALNAKSAITFSMDIALETVIPLVIVLLMLIPLEVASVNAPSVTSDRRVITLALKIVD